MSLHIALLRAVNLPGHNKVSMADLCGLLAQLGFTAPRSLLQSGNLIFGAGTRTPAEIEGLLEAAAKKRLGLATEFFVRDAKEWKAIVAGNPFADAAAHDPGHLVVMTLKAAPTKSAVAALAQAIPGREVVQAKGRQLYLVYPDGIGRSRLTAALIEKKLGTTGTGRNWNTVLKLRDLVQAGSAAGPTA